jgi:hypothetical protein
MAGTAEVAPQWDQASKVIKSGYKVFNAQGCLTRPDLGGSRIRPHEIIAFISRFWKYLPPVGYV